NPFGRKDMLPRSGLLRDFSGSGTRCVSAQLLPFSRCSASDDRKIQSARNTPSEDWNLLRTSAFRKNRERIQLSLCCKNPHRVIPGQGCLSDPPPGTTFAVSENPQSCIHSGVPSDRTRFAGGGNKRQPGSRLLAHPRRG